MPAHDAPGRVRDSSTSAGSFGDDLLDERQPIIPRGGGKGRRSFATTDAVPRPLDAHREHPRGRRRPGDPDRGVVHRVELDAGQGRRRPRHIEASMQVDTQHLARGTARVPPHEPRMTIASRRRGPSRARQRTEYIALYRVLSGFNPQRRVPALCSCTVSVRLHGRRPKVSVVSLIGHSRAAAARHRKGRPFRGGPVVEGKRDDDNTPAALARQGDALPPPVDLGPHPATGCPACKREGRR